MDVDTYLARVRRQFESEGWPIACDMIGGYETLVTMKPSRSQMRAVSPLVVLVSTRSAAEITHGALERYEAAARARTKQGQGRWGILPGVSVGGGFAPLMPVMVTAHAPAAAVSWASKKRGMVFPVLVDVEDASITRWRHAIIAADDGRAYAKIVDSFLRVPLSS